MIHIETPFGEVLCGNYNGRSLTMADIVKKRKQSLVCKDCKNKSLENLKDFQNEKPEC